MGNPFSSRHALNTLAASEQNIEHNSATEQNTEQNNAMFVGPNRTLNKTTRNLLPFPEHSVQPESEHDFPEHEH